MPERSTLVAHRHHPRAVISSRGTSSYSHCYRRKILMTTTYLNDVDLPTVGALVQAVQEDPDKGQTTWKSEVTWGGAFRTTAQSRDLAPVAFDEPPGLGGTNTAPNPVEQLLGALGSCLVIGYAANASVAGIELKDLRIELE